MKALSWALLGVFIGVIPTLLYVKLKERPCFVFHSWETKFYRKNLEIQIVGENMMNIYTQKDVIYKKCKKCSKDRLEIVGQ